MCKKCSIQFQDKNTLRDHNIKSHNAVPQKSLLCPHCAKLFRDSRDLKVHIRSVHENLHPFECQICGKKYKFKVSLIRHTEVVHEGKKLELNFQCQFCTHATHTPTALKRHIDAVHEKKKPFVCNTCNTRFAEKGHLKTHIRGVHEGLRPFECQVCKNTFKSKQMLNNHAEKNHRS